jgi:hypothetical protein
MKAPQVAWLLVRRWCFLDERSHSHGSQKEDSQESRSFAQEEGQQEGQQEVTNRLLNSKARLSLWN